MKHKILLIIALLLIATTFTACWDNKYFEDIGFILTTTAEYKDNNLLISFVLPSIGAQNKSKEEIEIISVIDAKNTRDAREKSRLVSQKLSEAGKMQQFLISRDLAEKGIGNFFQLFERDITNSTQAYAIVVEGSPTDLINNLNSLPSKPRASFYINQLIKNNIKMSYIPETRIFNVGICKFSEGIDFIIPTIKFDKNGMIATGSALFSKNAMVGKIDTKETSLLLGMMNKFKTSEYIASQFKDEAYSYQPNHGIAIKIKKFKSKIDIDLQDDIPSITINLKIDSILDEKSLNIPMDREYQKIIQDHLSKEIKNDCIKILNYTKDVGSDPLGIGNLVRARNNDYWKKVSLKETYKKISFKVNVSVNINNFGLFK